MKFSEVAVNFSGLSAGTIFLSDKFSDPKNEENLREFQKIGNDLVREKKYLQVVADIVYYGNARRKSDNLLFKFSGEDKVFPIILV